MPSFRQFEAWLCSDMSTLFGFGVYASRTHFIISPCVAVQSSDFLHSSCMDFNDNRAGLVPEEVFCLGRSQTLQNVRLVIEKIKNSLLARVAPRVVRVLFRVVHVGDMVGHTIGRLALVRFYSQIAHRRFDYF